MFLSELTLLQRGGFGVLVHEVAHADGRLAGEEQTVLARLEAEGGPLPNSTAMSFENALSTFVETEHRRAAMIELIGVCWSDGVLADEEALVLDRIADAWAIEPSLRSDMIDWVKRQTALLTEARTLIGVER